VKDNSPEHHTHMLMCRMVLNNVIVPPAPEKAMNADVEKAVEAVRAALNDWTATYASEFCDEDAVTAAYKRISNEGTLGYICDAHGALGKISQALRDQDTEIVGLRMDERQRLAEMVELSARAEKADALLRDIKRWDLNQVFDPKPDYLYALPYDLRDRITAHLGGEHE
jgi:hypothetical protein